MSTDPGNISKMEGQKIARARFKLIAIILIFAGPLAFAFIWYYGFGASFAPSEQSNNAPLIAPVSPLEAFENPVVAGGSFDNSALGRKWTIVHMLEDGCAENCQKSLYNTRQIRVAVGKDIKRIQRVFILVESAQTANIGLTHPDAILLRDVGGGLGEQIRMLAGKNEIGAHDAVLIDPLGNAMMVIPLELDPRLLLKDLKKLLKLSHIG